jgi:hypothetical protein
MRVSEDRYSRDIRRIHLARRLIRYEVRTQWICQWTGLTQNRVRNLCRSYTRELGSAARHRGPSPNQVQNFVRSGALRNEASALGGLGRVLGVIPAQPVPEARKTLPGVALGERLCQALELYRRIVPESQFTMEQFILLVIELARGQEFELGFCQDCNGVLLVDQLGAYRRRCYACHQVPASRRTELTELTELSAPDSPAREPEPPDEGGLQRSLFE